MAPSMASFDQLPADLELGLAGRGEPDLDLLHPDVHQGVEILQLLGQVHGVHQGLVAVPQVHRAPDRGLDDPPVGPGAPLDGLGLEGDVLFKSGLHHCVLLDKDMVLDASGGQKTPLTKKSGA